MKTLNVLKKASLVVIFLLVGTVVFATSAEVAVAEKKLGESVKETFKNDISKVGNYLYENKIVKLNDVVNVTFKVNDSNDLVLLKASCSNCNASEYAKYVFGLGLMKADDLLAGKAYEMDIVLKFKAK